MMAFDGSKRQFYQEDIPNGVGLAVFQNYVYWIDQNMKGVRMHFHRK